MLRTPDPGERQKRQVKELEAYTQELCRDSERARALLSDASRMVASSERVDPAVMVRPFLPTLGHWCLIDQVVNGRGERRLVALDSSLAHGARSVEGELALDGDASLGLRLLLTDAGPQEAC